MAAQDFGTAFDDLTGHPPFPWQERLFGDLCRGEWPAAVDLPTGLGKTSVMAVWYLALQSGADVPRRLVYVVDRRAVVDQATTIAEDILSKSADADLRVSTLRGRLVDNRAWLSDPTAPAIIVGTVDMIGSRLLFSGYGVSAWMRPYHAGLLGADALVVLDEAHLVPPFEALLQTIAAHHDGTLGVSAQEDRRLVPCFRLLPLSATARSDRQPNGETVFRLGGEDLSHLEVRKRLTAGKRLTLAEAADARALVAALAERAWELASGPPYARVLVYCNSREDALKVKDEIAKRAAKGRIEAPVQLLVGERRVHEREALFTWLKEHGYIAGSGEPPKAPTFLVATSAGEVGVDLDADHMVGDLVEWERMVQRLGRVNRRGHGQARIEIVAAPPKDKKGAETWDDRLARLRAPLDALAEHEEGGRDASPAAIVALKQRAESDPELRSKLEDATTPEPLRPALTRPLVEAWAMTSLDEHTGRPDIQPWLRGWVEDDEPQTNIVWRRWLPWRQGAEAPIKADVEAFFAVARPHLEETLEARTWRVVDWLIARAERAMKVALRPPEEGAIPVLTPSDPAMIVLGRKGGLEVARRIGELAELGRKDRKRDRDALAGHLSGRTLVVAAALCGLTEDGMLDDSCSVLPSALDQGWSEQDLHKRIGYRIVGPGEDEPAGTGWKLGATVVLGRPEDSESGEEKLLRVYVARGLGAGRAGDPAIASGPQSLCEHHQLAGEAAAEIAEALELPEPYRRMLVRAAECHDAGKDRVVWQTAMNAPRQGRPYAKTAGGGDGRRLNHYRHEFGTLGDLEANGALADLDEDLRELALHLIAAHHGRARPAILAYDPGRWETRAAQEARARQAALRFARLQRRWGPWGLAWWEALLRAADWRASARHDEAAAAQAIAGQEEAA